MFSRVVLAALIVAVAVNGPVGVLHAQQEKLEVNDADTVKVVLERHLGKRLAVVLSTGQEMSGMVATVTRDVLHLSELAGREFYDAVVPLDRINAVVIRVRSR
jgi:hypothetical protein